MKAKLIPFILGAVIGGLGVFFASQSNDPPVVPVQASKPSPPRITPDSDAKKIARLEKKIAELEATNSTASVEEKNKEAKESSVVKVFGADGASIDLAEISEKMEQSQKKRTEKLINSKLAKLTSKLNLSDEQAEKVRELLEKDAASQGGGMQILLSSALSGGFQNENKSPTDFDFDAELNALLDDDQKEAYVKHIEAQNLNYVEASANRELAQLQTGIPDLTIEQKDRAFDAFTQLAQDEVATDGIPNTGGMNFDVARMMKQRQAKKDALDDILTPEQSETYNAENSNTFSLGGAPGQVITSSVVIDSVDITPPAEDDGE